MIGRAISAGPVAEPALRDGAAAWGGARPAGAGSRSGIAAMPGEARVIKPQRR